MGKVANLDYQQKFGEEDDNYEIDVYYDYAGTSEELEPSDADLVYHGTVVKDEMAM